MSYEKYRETLRAPDIERLRHNIALTARMERALYRMRLATITTVGALVLVIIWKAI